MKSLFLLGALLCVVACGGNREKTTFDPTHLRGAAPVDEHPRTGGTFVWGRSGDAKKLDPALVSDGESVMVLTNLFETLVTFAPGTTKLVPGLATEWDRSADGLVWTFKLRRGVTFHDGSPFNADAVVFTFERQMRSDHPARRPEDAFGTFASYFGRLKSVAKVDDFTVTFTLSRPYGPFLDAMSLYCVGIVSPAAFASRGKDADGRYRYDFASHPVGTGPFRFKSWQRDVQIVLEANEHYWQGRPYLDRVVFRPIANPQARLKELEAGGIQGMDNPDLIDLASIHANPDLRLLGQEGLNVCYLAMHTLKKPFDDPRVRRAVAFSIDKRRLIQAAFNSTADPAVTMCPAAMRMHAPLVDRRPDLRRARRLLAEAGYPDGFETSLWYGSAQRAYLPNPGDTAIQIREDLKQVGIQVKLRKLEWTAYLAAVQSGQHEMCLLGWMADHGDPDGFLYVLLDKTNARVGSADNVSFYQGGRVHTLLEKARSVYDQGLRERLYREVQEIVFRDAPVLPLASVRDFRVLRREVRGYRIYPAGGEYFGRVSLAK